MRLKSVLVLIVLCSVELGAQSIVGKWKTIDDTTGKPKSVVEIFESDGKYYGKIIKLYPDPGEDPDPVCTECTGRRKGQKVIGMQIIEDMEKEKDGDYSGGEIMDPENGKTYTCKLWVEDGFLKVRGYLLFLYRTQTWEPYNG
ncbi:MAG: DUF2147 domain-containing protein [Bacteroidota bacterium]